ncbi:MAG: type II glyceraldehyde-3-phosphate dehydrogenase [Nitrosopumilus sp. B06]|nr:MAG: type II glyceraldehyde-3-phosphate dehydrogenase [Nitrosopumilus sp. D6]RNJ80152.1 MAG: type II glyceraldehyde-3-phosphate dehydrogenase [Nitrosopumilus sp. B06]
MKRVFVNGYGSIGSRISSFLRDDPEITLVGVGKYSPDERINSIKSKGLDVYVPEGRLDEFAEYDIAGSIESALDSCDLVIDASPGRCGYKNKKSLYEPRNIKAIYQGGESVTGSEAVSEILFNSGSNYDSVIGKKHVMQGSCNVTGMGRILEPMRVAFGDRLIRFDVTLVRRWADIEQTDKQVIDTIEMTENPHHGDDVKTYLGEDTPLYVRAVKVPTRQMHLHILDARFSQQAPRPSEIHALYANNPGVAVLWTAKGTQDVREFARTMGFHFTDTNMIHIHANMTASIGDTVQMMYSDDQTGIVIPENHMLMQAMLFERQYRDARAHTESVFGMDAKKQKLEKFFAKS